MPVMNIIFGKQTPINPVWTFTNQPGRMVGSFTSYYSYDAATTTEVFRRNITQCAYVHRVRFTLLVRTDI